MPFKSEAQHRKFRAMVASGEMPKSTLNKWMKETKAVHGKENPIKALPEKVAFKQVIPGGLADDKKPSDFDAKALQKGVKVELEHTSSKTMAKEITMDHLTEDPKYYEKLDKMEKGAFFKGFYKKAGMGTHLAETAGLGLLMVPSLNYMSGKPLKNKTTHKLEVAGLSTLAAPSVINLLGRLMRRGK